MSTERAVLAGGCFWGMQDLIRRMPGVVSTRVGYTAAHVATRPTATMTAMPRRSRSSSIRQKPAPQDLEFFFQIHDPRR